MRIAEDYAIEVNGVLILSAGYKTFTGHVMTQWECEKYNRMTEDVESHRHPESKAFFADRRAEFFNQVCQRVYV